MPLRRKAIGVALVGLITMCAGLTYAFNAGDWERDVPNLISNPWGVATLLDVYVGLGIFSVWVCIREAKPADAAIWIIGILVMGNLGTALYLLRASWSSAGNPQTFWTGTRGSW